MKGTCRSAQAGPEPERQGEVGGGHQVAVGLGRRADGAHVQHRGDRRARRPRNLELLRRQQAGDGVLRQVAPLVLGAEAVDHHHLLAPRGERGDEVGADETGPAGDQIHGGIPVTGARWCAAPARGIGRGHAGWKGGPLPRHAAEEMAMSDTGGGGKRGGLFDDLAGVAGGAFSALAGVRGEAEAAMRSQVDAMVQRLDLVKREDLDAAMELARRAREAQEGLEARVAALEAQAGGDGAPGPAPAPAPAGQLRRGRAGAGAARPRRPRRARTGSEPGRLGRHAALPAVGKMSRPGNAM